MTTPPLYEHQKETVAFLNRTPRAFDTSDPGVGKTRSTLEHLRTLKPTGKALVIAPKTILYPAWGADIERYTPNLTYVIAYASNRAKAFTANVDVYLTNHDATSWLAKRPASFFKGFSTLVVDEFTAFKHRAALRSRSLRAIAKHFEHRIFLSGTPTPNTILDIWHPALLVDDGETLGSNFWSFRQTVSEPVQNGPLPNHVIWQDKPGSAEAVASLLAPITIRHKLEECIDMPEHTVHTVPFRLPSKQRLVYDRLRADALLELNNGNVDPINAAALRLKLLQVSSGAVYYAGEDHPYETLDTSRTELILDLVDARPHSLVAFNWKHQRDALTALADKRGLSFAVIDGSVSQDDRSRIVTDFQAGQYRVLFAHPQSAGHGLTLTRATSTIWASPTDHAEHFQQFNRRIYRSGQTQRTETLLITAEDTLEPRVYENLQNKLDTMSTLLELLQ